MKITCEVCNRSLGEIAGKLRNGDHAAKFICAECLTELQAAKRCNVEWRGTEKVQGDDLFNTLFGGGLRR